MSAPATRRVRRIGSDIMFHGHLITKEFLDSIPVGPFTIIPTSPAAMEAHVEAMANALCCEHMGALPGAYSLTPEKDCAKGSESAYMWRSARAALAALIKGRTGAPRRA